MTRRRTRWVFWTLLLAVALAPLLSSEPRTARLAGNTLLLSAAVVGLSVPPGSVLAFLLTRTDLPGRRTVGGLLAGFLFLPLYVQAGAWQAALGTEGWLTSLIGGPPLVAAWRGAIWIHAVGALPWAVLIVGAGLSLVERELEEQALLDGAAWQVIWHVTIRRAAAAIGVTTLWIALLTAGEMSVTDFFQVRTFAEEIYTAFALGDIQPPLGGSSTPYDPNSGLLGASGIATGIAVTGSMLACALVLVAMLSPLTRRGSLRTRLVFELGRWRWPAAAGMWVIVGVLLVLPLASLVWKAGVEVVDLPTGRAREWSATKCMAMVALNPRIDHGRIRFRHRREIGWSLAIDGAAATVAVLLALCAAWFARRGQWRAWAGLASVATAMAIPGPVIGLAIIAVLNRPEIPGFTYLYDRTIAGPCLGCVVRAFPLAMLILWPAFRALPNELLEAAELEGAGFFDRLWLVVLPLRWPALVLAWVVAFVWSLGELDASVLVAPPGIQPLSNHIFGLLHFGAQDQVAGLCLAVYLAMQAAAVLGWWLARKAMLPVN